MLTHPADPARTLLEPSDLDAVPLPAVVGTYRDALRATVDWAREYLCRPHPELGRHGPVCPYVQGALDKRTFYMAVHPGTPTDLGQVGASLLGYRDWFEELEPSGRDPYLTILVLFPDLASENLRRVIEDTQRELKSDYAGRGLMIGEFHNGPPAKPGLRNEEFRPLCSPVPLLAIRHMVPSDFPFLSDDPAQVAAYLAWFGTEVPPHLRTSVRAAMDRFGLEPSHASAGVQQA